MNKIYSDPMAKAESMAEGIRRNAGILQEHGIHIDTTRLEQTRKALEDASARQEEAEAALREARDRAHALLSELKELCNEAKYPIKMNFPPEKWQQFGLADKR